MSRLISYLRICFLKIFNVSADLTFGDNFPHNLGPRYRKESPKAYCISFVEFVKFRCLLIHNINLVPKALPLEIGSPKFVSEKVGTKFVGSSSCSSDEAPRYVVLISNWM